MYNIYATDDDDEDDDYDGDDDDDDDDDDLHKRMNSFHQSIVTNNQTVLKTHMIRKAFHRHDRTCSDVSFCLQAVGQEAVRIWHKSATVKRRSPE